MTTPLTERKIMPPFANQPTDLNFMEPATPSNLPVFTRKSLPEDLVVGRSLRKREVLRPGAEPVAMLRNGDLAYRRSCVSPLWNTTQWRKLGFGVARGEEWVRILYWYPAFGDWQVHSEEWAMELSLSQAEILRNTNVEELVKVALLSMHALNRQARHYRDQRSFDGRLKKFAIYQLKDRFLSALVGAHLATVERFEHERIRGWWCPCGEYERESGDKCLMCGGLMRAESTTDTWFLVRVGGFSWHQPGLSASPMIKQVATPGRPHDPTQPAVDVPDVGLLPEVQWAAVTLATQRLNNNGTINLSLEGVAPMMAMPALLAG